MGLIIRQPSRMIHVRVTRRSGTPVKVGLLRRRSGQASRVQELVARIHAVHAGCRSPRLFNATGCRNPRLETEASERDTEHHSGTNEQDIRALNRIPDNANQRRECKRGGYPAMDPFDDPRADGENHHAARDRQSSSRVEIRDRNQSIRSNSHDTDERDCKAEGTPPSKTFRAL